MCGRYLFSFFALLYTFPGQTFASTTKSTKAVNIYSVKILKNIEQIVIIKAVDKIDF